MTLATPSTKLFHLDSSVRDKLEPSPTLLINERVNEMWNAGKTVYHLGFGESRFPVHPKIWNALRDHADKKSYLAGQGLFELRKAVAGFYTRKLGMEVTSDQVIIGPGSKPVFFVLQMALDADLILPTPSWVSYGPQARLIHKRVYQVPATSADGYALTLEKLDQTVRQSTNPAKILLINSPNNPTGQMFDHDFLIELGRYCREQGIIVLSDEIYGLIPHGRRTHYSLVNDYPEGTIVLGGLSKHLSLGGWRLGAAVLPNTPEGKRLMQALRVIASEIWSSPTGPVQYAAVTAYNDDAAIDAYVQECARIHTIRTQYLWHHIAAMGVPCVQPDGGFYMFPSFNPWRGALAKLGITTSPELAAYLLETYQISSLPGTAFGVAPAELSLRLASSYLDMETDAKAQAILDAYRRDPDPEALMRDYHPHTQEALKRLRIFVESLV
ncbi:MAG: aminotransferase class I/II-fold pyridoxal phosphate-dependent enzyme [Caldilineaceae bacterium]